MAETPLLQAKKVLRGFWMPDQVRHDEKLFGLFLHRVKHPVASDSTVIPAKPVLDPDRGAGTWISDKPYRLSGMTTEEYPAPCGGWFTRLSA
jgi:hypothetical protein